MSAAFAMTPTARATPSPSLRASSIAARRAVVAPAAARRLAPSSSSRSSRATRVVATRAEYGDVERARGQDYNASANVFVDAFFLRGKPAGDNAITPSELSYLRGAQRKDLTRRYNRRGDAAMFVIRDDDGNGDVVGCVGAEVQRFQGIVPLSRADAETKGEVLDRPVIANLAVAASARRRGVAKRLMRAVEDEIRGWGYDEAVLVVESSNGKAKGLYGKLGYKVVGGEAATPNIVISAEGKVVNGAVRTSFMRKDLTKPDGGAGAPPAAVVVAVAVAVAVAAKVGGVF